jgi:hypothetical protein
VQSDDRAYEWRGTVTRDRDSQHLCAEHLPPSDAKERTNNAALIGAQLERPNRADIERTLLLQSFEPGQLPRSILTAKKNELTRSNQSLISLTSALLFNSCTSSSMCSSSSPSSCSAEASPPLTLTLTRISSWLDETTRSLDGAESLERVAERDGAVLCIGETRTVVLNGRDGIDRARDRGR